LKNISNGCVVDGNTTVVWNRYEQIVHGTTAHIIDLQGVAGAVHIGQV
jgi:hypothetical protein